MKPLQQYFCMVPFVYQYFTKRVSACTSFECVRNMGVDWIACTIFSICNLSIRFHELQQISCEDRQISRVSFRFGYLKEVTPVIKMLESSDRRLCKSVTSSTGGPLVDLLPPMRSRLLRNRGHPFSLPAIRTERFKRSFINRFLFKFI